MYVVLHGVLWLSRRRTTLMMKKSDASGSPPQVRLLYCCDATATPHIHPIPSPLEIWPRGNRNINTGYRHYCLLMKKFLCNICAIICLQNRHAHFRIIKYRTILRWKSINYYFNSWVCVLLIVIHVWAGDFPLMVNLTCND